MAKINADLTNVSTEYVLIEPSTYRLRVKEVDLNEKDGKAEKSGLDIKRATHIIKSEVVSLADGSPSEHEKKTVTDFINIHTKEGELNEISLGNLKRYFNACLGEGNYDFDDADTDQLVGMEFLADVYIDSYTPAGSTNARETNKIKPQTIVPVA